MLGRLSFVIRKLEVKYFKIRAKIFKNQLIVVTGCGRSGTTFSSKWLKEAGFDVGHERLGKGGVSSWYLCSGSSKVPLGPSYSDIKDLNLLIIHQVRDPLDAISSMQATGKPSWRFLSKEIPINNDIDSKVLKAMKYYYYWNLKAEYISSHRVNAEFFEVQIEDIFRKEEIVYSTVSSTFNRRKKVNTREHVILKKADLFKEDEVLASKIFKMASEYGYDY